MANKGFTIQDELCKLGLLLKIPPLSTTNLKM